MVAKFEEEFADFTKIPSLAVSNGGAGLLALFEYCDVRKKDVIVPANTFWATSAAAKRAGANVIYADCNKDDLCISLDDIKKKVTSATKAIAVVHIGGHIAFEIEEIAEFCRLNNIYLIEDCAHAHGASFHGKTAGSWGLGGAYSFYATKTMPLGEGGMICSLDEDFMNWFKYYRNYGKHVVDGKVSYKMQNGFNFRMNEVTAALGIVQMQQLHEILSWKRVLARKYDKIFDRRIHFPKSMESGYYKYIVFDYSELKLFTGQVFGPDDLGPAIEGIDVDLPNTYWVVNNHKCPPIYYGWEYADLKPEELKIKLTS